MAVLATVPWQSLPILGPPEVMLAVGSVTGDGTGGTATLEALPSINHFWMITHVWFQAGAVAALELLIQMSGLSGFQNAAGSFEFLTENLTLPAQATHNVSRIFIPPPVIWAPVAGSTLLVQTPNVTTVVYQFGARAVRWDRSEPIPAFVAYMTSPQR